MGFIKKNNMRFKQSNNNNNHNNHNNTKKKTKSLKRITNDLKDILKNM